VRPEGPRYHASCDRRRPCVADYRAPLGRIWVGKPGTQAVGLGLGISDLWPELTGGFVSRRGQSASAPLQLVGFADGVGEEPGALKGNA